MPKRPGRTHHAAHDTAIRSLDEIATDLLTDSQNFRSSLAHVVIEDDATRLLGVDENQRTAAILTLIADLRDRLDAVSHELVARAAVTGLSQRETAQRLGVSHQTVNRWLADTRPDMPQGGAA